MIFKNNRSGEGGDTFKCYPDYHEVFISIRNMKEILFFHTCANYMYQWIE